MNNYHYRAPAERDPNNRQPMDCSFVNNCGEDFNGFKGNQFHGYVNLWPMILSIKLVIRNWFSMRIPL